MANISKCFREMHRSSFYSNGLKTIWNTEMQMPYYGTGGSVMATVERNWSVLKRIRSAPAKNSSISMKMKLKSPGFYECFRSIDIHANISISTEMALHDTLRCKKAIFIPRAVLDNLPIYCNRKRNWPSDKRFNFMSGFGWKRNTFQQSLTLRCQ